MPAGRHRLLDFIESYIVTQHPSIVRMGFLFWWLRTQTHLLRRALSAAGEGLTEPLLSQIESYIVYQKENHTEGCGFLF